MRNGDLTYDDFLQRLNIQDILIDAGYHLNKRDGLRYPSYVRMDSEGRRIRGDKARCNAAGQNDCRSGSVSSFRTPRHEAPSRSPGPGHRRARGAESHSTAYRLSLIHI